MVRELQVKFVKTAMTAITVLLLAVICAICGIYSVGVYRDARWTAQMLAEHGGAPAFDDMKEAGRDPDEWESDDWFYGDWDPDDRYEDDFDDTDTDDSDSKDTGTDEGSANPQPGEEGREAGPPSHKGENGSSFFRRRMSPDDVMAVRYFLVNYNAENAVESTDTANIYSVTDEEAQEYGLRAAKRAKESGILGNFFYYIAERDGGRTAAFIDVSSQISAVLSVVVISLVIAAAAWALMFIFVSVLSRRAIAPIAENIVRQKQFVTNAGHELKTPLAIILTNTEALELFNGESKWTRNIKAQTKRLSGLMQNLLTLSKMDEADLKLPMQYFDLGELIKEAAAPFEVPAQEKKLEFIVETPQIKVNANRDTIGQLIGILLDNAVKYTPEGGKITLTAFSEGKYAVLRQSNTIDPSDVEENPDKLFDRFYRRDEARTQKKGGYGIGLSAARAIAAANKAQISVCYNEQESIVFDVKMML